MKKQNSKIKGQNEEGKNKSKVKGWMGSILAFCIVLLLFTFAFWSWYFGLGILVLTRKAVSNQQSAASY